MNQHTFLSLKLINYRIANSLNLPPQTKSILRHMKSLSHWYTTFTTGVGVPIEPRWMKVWLFWWVPLMAMFVVLFMIPNTKHVGQ